MRDVTNYSLLSPVTITTIVALILTDGDTDPHLIHDERIDKRKNEILKNTLENVCVNVGKEESEP